MTSFIKTPRIAPNSIMIIMLLIVLLLSPLAFGQASRYDSQVTTINQSAPQPGGQYPVLAIPGSAVAICSFPANAVPCTNYATTLSAPTGGITCPTNAQLTRPDQHTCVANADAEGGFGAWMVAGNYQYTITTAYGSFGPYDFTVGGTGSGSGGSVVGINVVTAGADPTGTIDSSAVFSSVCASNPNGTSFLPQGTYLLAATGNLTLPSNCNHFFANGAQIKTGNQGSSAISSIQRSAYNAGSYTTSLAGCTSAATLSNTEEQFTNCPNTFTGNILLITTGTTNVPACPYGCSIVAVTGTSFTIVNKFVTANVSASTETGSSIFTHSSVVLNLTGLGATSSSSSSPGNGVVTINVANNFQAIPQEIVLAGTTNLAAGGYILIPSSVTPTSFQMVCYQHIPCTNKSLAAETGSAQGNSDGLTYVHFATPLAGAPAPGVYFSNGFAAPFNGAGGGIVICTGTTNYNGPYWVSLVADSQDMAFLDPRATVATETSGNCYVPYTASFLGPIQASTGQQIVQANGAVSFQGMNTEYVGWYGALGAIASADDSLAFQGTMFWNPGKHILAPSTAAPSYGQVATGSNTYNIAQTLQMYGNMQILDGGVSSAIWEGGTILNCDPAYVGACIITRPDTAGATLENLELSGQFCQGVAAHPIPNLWDLPDYDGWFNGGGEPIGRNLVFHCFRRSGVHIISDSGFDFDIMGSPSPDYWHLTNILTNGNAYGVGCWGHDCNAGVYDGQNDARNAGLGGIICFAQICPALSGINGESDDPGFTAGPNQTITALALTNPGAYNTTCTATLSASLPANFQPNIWVIVAGTNGSGGLAGTDNSSGGFTLTSWQILSINSGSNQVTFSCPGATGGPGSTGTIQTADSNSLYSSFWALPNGNFTNTWETTGTGAGQGAINTGGYMESTASCPFGGGFISGSSEIYEFLGGQSCNGQNPIYPSTFAGSFWGGSGTIINGIATSIKVQTPSYNGGTMSFNMVNGLGGSGTGSTFTGTTTINFCATSTNTCDYTIQELPGGNFQFTHRITGDNVYSPFIMYPNTGANYISYNAPSLSGNIRFNKDTGTPGQFTGFIDFFANNGVADITTIEPVAQGGFNAGITTPGVTTAFMTINGTKFTTNAGCSEATTTGGATGGHFTVGTASACTTTITMGNSATAAHGWVCTAWDITTPAHSVSESGTSTTTVILGGTFSVNDVIWFSCTGV